jgi:hypothetical protein
MRERDHKNQNTTMILSFLDSHLIRTSAAKCSRGVTSAAGIPIMEPN